MEDIQMSGGALDASAGVDSMLDSLFADAGSELQTTSAAVADAPAEETAASTPQDGEVAEPATEDEAAAEDQNGEPEAAEQTDEQEDEAEKGPAPGESQPQWMRRNQAYKWAKGVVQAITGEEVKSLDPALLPSVEEIKQFRDGYFKQAKLEASFLSGDPTHARSFVEQWDKASPEAMGVVAEQMQDYLARANGAAYERMAAPILNRVLDGIEREAKSATNPEIRENLGTALMWVEYYLTGQFRQIDGPAESGQEKAPPNPALAAREAEIERREAAFREQERRAQAQSTQEWQKAVDTAHSRALSERVDKALDPLKQAYEKAPKVYEALRDKFVSEVREKVKQSPNFDLLKINYAKVLRSRDAGELQKLSADYSAVVDRAVIAHLPAYMKSAKATAVPAQQARREQLQRQASKPTPTSVGAPKAQPLTPDMKGMTLDQKIETMLGL